LTMVMLVIATTMVVTMLIDASPLRIRGAVAAAVNTSLFAFATHSEVSLATPMLSVAIALAGDRRWPWQGATLLFVVPLVFTHLATTTAAVVIGIITAIAVDAAEQQRLRALRLAWWQLSMMGGLGVLLPWHTSMTIIPVADLEHVLAEPVGIPPAVAVLLLIIGTTMMTWTCHDLLRDGGTPDPFDPPRRWQSTGLYRRWRHPMQAAQLCCFGAAASALDTLGGVITCCCVAVIMVGPMRRWEAVLNRRFCHPLSHPPGL
jgi:protein-S-isoprenylcysteine O-methyltransferase Ste14